MIMVDGNIGAGKSTISRRIADEFSYTIYEELINKQTETLLERFYNDMTRWAFTLQVHFLNERFRMIKEAPQSSIIDRSIYGDLVFAHVLHQDGHMTDEEYKIYKTLFHNMEEHFDKPSVLIYLDVSPDKALQRIKKRGRPSEAGITLPYLEKLESEYKRLISDYYGKIEIIDYNQDNNEDVVNNILEIIKSY